jgi:hypothetical protein
MMLAAVCSISTTCCRSATNRVTGTDSIASGLERHMLLTIRHRYEVWNWASCRILHICTTGLHGCILQGRMVVRVDRGRCVYLHQALHRMFLASFSRSSPSLAMGALRDYGYVDLPLTGIKSSALTRRNSGPCTFHDRIGTVPDPSV